jgi:hypothetical protein
MPDKKNEIQIRMYRVGFGDCFLISIGASEKRHILVDFGAHQKGKIGTLDRVMDQIERDTGKRLALVVVSHAHADHVSGFGDFADRFAQFQIGEVWLPWTENLEDKDAKALRKKQLALCEALHTHFVASNPKASPNYAAAVAAVNNLRDDAPAMTALRRGFGVTDQVHYLTGGEPPRHITEIPGLSVEVLAPPRNPDFLGRMDPPAGQRFLTTRGSLVGKLAVFERQWVGDTGPLRARQESSLHELADPPADLLAFTLDSIVNNTSLVLLFHYHAKTLLFPGDAQWGNWQSWITKDSAKDILADVDFLKVAHHGSHNATPKDVVSWLPKEKFAVMVPTQDEPFDTIPRMPLLQSLSTQSGRALVRSDSIEVQGAPRGPKLTRLPKGFKRGELWFDYTIKV